MRLPPGSVESRGEGGGGEAAKAAAEEGQGNRRVHRGRQRPPPPPPRSLPPQRRRGAFLPGDHVSRLLAANFRALSLLGPWALGPFVRERVRLLPLAAALLATGTLAPRTVARVLRQVGPLELARWAFHAAALAAFALLRVLASPLRGFVSAERSRRRQRSGAEAAASSSAAGAAGTASASSRAKFLARRALAARAFAALGRLVDALEYGSGHDGSGEGSSPGVRIVSA